MLSRLISLLSRIPAVKWAFTRLRPPPHSGSIDVAPIAADEQPAVIVDIADAAPALDGIRAEPLHRDAKTAATPVVEDQTAISVIAEGPPAAPTDISVGEVPSLETPAKVEPVILDEISISSVEVESEPSELVIEDEPASTASAEIEPTTVDATPVIVVAIEIPAPVVVEDSIDSDPAVSVVTEIEPSPVPEICSAAKPRAKAPEPVDRATLIRQRWTETGIRMWNPRLHGTGDATLNIQGRIELLPPEPGETMPRYDKLEFKMLGGQIVCEGVIVEAPAHASQRSFTRLAEPRGADRTREPARERQAALA